MAVKFKLCFVDSDTNTAYFTNLPLTSVTGLNWGEVPYQQFAFPPEVTSEQAKEGFAVIPLRFDGYLQHRCDRDEEGFSANYINQNATTEWWMCHYCNFFGDYVYLRPGASPMDFIHFIKNSKGEVYVPFEYIDKFSFEKEV